jgi:cell division protein FtsQ
MWATLIIGVFALTGFINKSISEEKCSEVIIDIEDADNYGFISESDIVELLNKEFKTPISQKVKDINTDAIEKALNNHQAVERADAYISIDGKLVVMIKQRKAILRVFSKDGSFYIDNKGKVMPTSREYTAHVPVASGNIALNYKSMLELTNKPVDELDSSLIPKQYLDLLKLSKYIDSKPFWKAQIEQLYVNKESEIELIPRVGNHIIVLGEVYELDSKFEKLMMFYKKGLSKTGWNE